MTAQDLVPPVRIAVLVPCYNEAAAVAQVVRDFRAALPDSEIYVFDNNSTDGTAEIAQAAGALVRREGRKGKGNVVRRMFADVEADLYIMVDGDATYDASAAPRLIAAALEGGYDMVNVARVETAQKAYRPGHRFGNALLTGLVGRVFGTQTADMLSGYKIFTRRFVKSFPAMSGGFEIETEIMIHALELGIPIGEISAPYGERPEDSASKLQTWRDGFRILRMIGELIRRERPLEFFGVAALAMMLASLGLGLPVVFEFWESGLVPRLPTALLSAAIMLAALMSFAVGLMLDAVTRSRQELKRLAYLAIPPLR
ncbi:glycosyltransferase family 2 protein [Roseococcus sp.]|uniref:glycosyltransferase family 2 protein n=1 Tax=Roseococcus sp. TaxID=2109646 RepID=UPI003BAA3F67